MLTTAVKSITVLAAASVLSVSGPAAADTVTADPQQIMRLLSSNGYSVERKGTAAERSLVAEIDGDKTAVFFLRL